MGIGEMTPEELRQGIALAIHAWHCPDEAPVDELWWTGPTMKDYLDAADSVLSLLAESGACFQIDHIEPIPGANEFEEWSEVISLKSMMEEKNG
jgi:hypothetical protein